MSFPPSPIQKLIDASPVHRKWSPEAVRQLILEPGIRGHVIVFFEKEEPVGLLSFALLSEEGERALLDPNKRLHPDQWSQGDRLWFIDFIAPFGHARKILGHLRRSEVFKQFGEARWIRTYGTGTVQHIGRVHATPSSGSA